MLPEHAKSVKRVVSVGTLPSTWASPEAFPSLSTLILACSCIGALPPTWQSPSSFPQLQVLAVQAPNLTGDALDQLSCAAVLVMHCCCCHC